MIVPYIIYADFVRIIKAKTAKVVDKSEITSEHEACGFGYQGVKYDGQAEEPVIYRGKDTGEVWKTFNCKTLGDYHDLYLKMDVVLLADVFQTF